MRMFRRVYSLGTVRYGLIAGLLAILLIGFATQSEAGTCGNYCNGYYGNNWFITRTPIVTTNSHGVKSTTGESVNISSSPGGLSITYTDVYGTKTNQTDCSASASLTFTRYGVNSNGTTNLYIGQCIMSGPNVLAEETNMSTGTPSGGSVMLKPTQFQSRYSAEIERYLERYADDQETYATMDFVNLILAFSAETDGCAAAH